MRAALEEAIELKSDPELPGFLLRAGEAITRGNNHFRDVLDLLPAAIYTTDAAGRITYYNQAAARLWGQCPELGESEWCGSWKLYWPDGRPLPHDQCPMALAIKEGRPNRGTEAVAERPDGIENTVHPLSDPPLRFIRHAYRRREYAGRYYRPQARRRNRAAARGNCGAF